MTEKQYKNIRNTGIEINNKFLSFLKKNESLLELATKSLKELRLYDITMEEMPFIGFFQEIFVTNKGMPLLEYYYRYSEDKFSNFEKEIIETKLAAKSSLFKVIDVFPNKNTISLESVWSKEQEKVMLYDINLSKTISVGQYFYTHLVNIGDFSITLGYLMLFSDIDTLQKSYNLLKFKKRNRISAKEEFLFFWNAYYNNNNRTRIITKNV